MKPQQIFKVLDLAKTAREKGMVFNPLFAGDAGLGKSQIIQQWAVAQQAIDPNFGYIDLRFAYLEAPDLIGLPQIKEKNGQIRTSHILPEFLPTEGTGVLVLEEPNRANSSVMNALMQLLTERKIHNYELPSGWVICAAINPDGQGYDVNTMDTALKDRFELFDVKYDHKGFMEFIEQNQWHPSLVSFLNSGTWIYKPADQIAENQHYISPRTWSKVNVFEQCGASEDSNLYHDLLTSAIGADMARMYQAYANNNKPVTVDELLNPKTKEASLKRLEEMSKAGAGYQGDKISTTTTSLLENYPSRVNEDLIAEVGLRIPADLAKSMVESVYDKKLTAAFDDHFKSVSTENEEFELKGGDEELKQIAKQYGVLGMRDVFKSYPDLLTHIEKGEYVKKSDSEETSESTKPAKKSKKKQ